MTAIDKSTTLRPFLLRRLWRDLLHTPVEMVVAVGDAYNAPEFVIVQIVAGKIALLVEHLFARDGFGVRYRGERSVGIVVHDRILNAVERKRHDASVGIDAARDAKRL